MAEIVVITRTQNRPLFLKRALESVICQSYQDWEMIIVNDGGERGLVDEICNPYAEKFKGKLRVIHHPEAMGMQAASNAAIKQSNSKYLVVHDDDDSWEPEFLKVTVGFMNSKEKGAYRGVMTHSMKIEEKVENDEIKTISSEPFNPELYAIDLISLARENLIVPIGFVYEREIHQKIGYYNESFPTLGDWEFYLRFVRYHDIHVIREPLANYHIRGEAHSEENRNSIIKNYEKGQIYQTLMANHFLREDMDNNKMGMGILFGLARNYNHLKYKVDLNRVLIDSLPFRRLVRLVKKILGLNRGN